MFEIPDAKRVRREELYDSSSDRSSPERETEDDAALREKLNARLSNLLSLEFSTITAPPQPVEQTSTQDAQPANVDEIADEEEEFAFRLFSTSEIQKVVLVSEDDAKFEGPAISQRPISHYIRRELTPAEREQFRIATVTGQDILAWARQRAWGLEVPWRVTKLTVVGKAGKGAAASETQLEGSVEGKKKKKRLGKKSRIMMRKREKVRKEAEAVEEKKKMSKEEHLKEKKKRLNREKKLKRRAKEKEKKMAGKGEAGGEEAAGSGSEGSDMEE
ncbi:hypothetical protein N0V88_001196 [Collariella sp. IMI 366227]|nr:hypothetical protein N0V88_001196 [Collariella sp. IMI 366227]